METADSTLAYRVAHRVFLLGLILKGLNALVELVVGSVLLVVPLELIRTWVTAWVGWLATFVPPDWTPRLASFVEHMAPGGVAFVAWYFLSHGLLKAFVIGCLVRGKRWAYPLGIVVFVAFGIYQTWEYIRTAGVFYIVLDFLDVGLIVLTAMEWRHATHKASSVDTVSR